MSHSTTYQDIRRGIKQPTVLHCCLETLRIELYNHLRSIWVSGYSHLAALVAVMCCYKEILNGNYHDILLRFLGNSTITPPPSPLRKVRIYGRNSPLTSRDLAALLAKAESSRRD